MILLIILLLLLLRQAFYLFECFYMTVLLLLLQLGSCILHVTLQIHILHKNVWSSYKIWSISLDDSILNVKKNSTFICYRCCLHTYVAVTIDQPLNAHETSHFEWLVIFLLAIFTANTSVLLLNFKDRTFTCYEVFLHYGIDTFTSVKQLNTCYIADSDTFDLLTHFWLY